MRRARRLLGASIVLVAVAGLLDTTSVAAVRTTRPAPTVNMFVTLSDTSITITSYVKTGRTHSGKVARISSKAVTRGDVLNIQVRNVGTRVHNFSLFGFTTKPIRPAGKAHLFTEAISRGDYVYRSTLDSGSALKGHLRVV